MKIDPDLGSYCSAVKVVREQELFVYQAHFSVPLCNSACKLPLQALTAVCCHAQVVF